MNLANLVTKTRYWQESFRGITTGGWTEHANISSLTSNKLSRTNAHLPPAFNHPQHTLIGLLPAFYTVDDLQILKVRSPFIHR